MVALAQDLDGSIARRELEVWFQPQIDLRTSAVVGAEALCRWRHPRRGSVPPTEFIPAAEESGYIIEIGRFVAAVGCAAFAEWARIRPVDVSVNVSPRQLADGAFTDWLVQQLRRLRLGNRGYTVEVTEALPIGDAPAVIRRLDQLRRHGAGISIDDFGAGQASLTQLRRLHGTELKVDRVLIADESRETVALLRDVIDDAHEANVRVVAEGVETEEQLARVTRLGFDRVQGYLTGRPMPRDEFTRLLRAG